MAQATRKDKTMKSIIRKDEAAVSPVIATILMVAITVVLAAVLYVMVSGLITPVGGGKPLVQFGAVSQSISPGNATFDVASASQSLSRTVYRVNLQVAGTPGTAAALPTSGNFVSVTVGSSSYRVFWFDIGGEGNLNAGDTIRVTGGTGGALSAGTYSFILLWSADSSSIGTPVTWTMS